MFEEFCSHYVLSPIRTILEPYAFNPPAPLPCSKIKSVINTYLYSLIIPVILLAYLPQYIKTSRHGTAGISAQFMLRLCLFSTMQLATRLINPIGAFAVNCILYRGELHGTQAFSALIGYFQVLSQWLCVMILYVSRTPLPLSLSLRVRFVND
jgi:hypothetical protein